MIQENKLLTKWNKVKTIKQESDPKRIIIYEAEIKTDEYWISKGIKSNFKMYNVLMGYENQIQTITDLSKMTKQNSGVVIHINDEKIDLGKSAHIISFYGHNSFFDYSSMGLANIKETENSPNGIFFAGCYTMSVGNIPEKVESSKDIGIAYSTDFMVPEGYVALGLAEALSQGDDVNEILKKVNYSYQKFQGLNYTIKLFKTRLK